VDIQFRLPDGTRHRERYKPPVESKSGAMRWSQDRERHLLQHRPEPAKEVLTLEEFAPKTVRAGCESAGQLTTPKNGRGRFVAMTERVATALRKHRRPRDSRVLCKDDVSRSLGKAHGRVFGMRHGMRTCRAASTPCVTRSAHTW